ncbi:MAG: PQQ-binding-like beta-propeller repeat protein [Tepidisphaerales bacterium]
MFCFILVLATAAVAEENWPQFRGASQEGISDATGLPTAWSESQGVKWKTAIPGVGWSSPVIWGRQVWLTTATPDGRSRRAIGIDKSTGKIIHDVAVFKPAVPEPKNPFNSYASPTPVIEQGRVYVSFGTAGQACLDTSSGTILWKNEELKIDHMEGPGSSPILYKNLYIIHCDGTDAQYITALDKQTGKIAWKTPRSYDFEGTHLMWPMRKAFDVPTVARVDGKDQIISVGAKRVYGYEPETGREIWCCDIPGFSVATRPIYRDGVIYVGTGHMKAELWAIRIAGAKGNVTQTNVLWTLMQGVPLRSSPAVVGEHIYFTTDDGIARCIERKDGRQVWQKRIGTGFSASPLYAAGNLYFFSERGQTIVIKPGGDTPEIVGEFALDDGFLASPAVSGSALYLRTRTHLYRIEK